MVQFYVGITPTISKIAESLGMLNIRHGQVLGYFKECDPSTPVCKSKYTQLINLRLDKGLSPLISVFI